MWTVHSGSWVKSGWCGLTLQPRKEVRSRESDVTKRTRLWWCSTRCSDRHFPEVVRQALRSSDPLEPTQLSRVFCPVRFCHLHSLRVSKSGRKLSCVWTSFWVASFSSLHQFCGLPFPRPIRDPFSWKPTAILAEYLSKGEGLGRGV